MVVYNLGIPTSNTQYNNQNSSFNMKKLIPKRFPLPFHFWYGSIVRAKVLGERYTGNPNDDGKFEYEVILKIIFIQEVFKLQNGFQAPPRVLGLILNFANLVDQHILCDEDSQETYIEATDIVEVISHATIPLRPFNQHDVPYTPSDRFAINGGTFTGCLWEMAGYVLGHMPVFIDRLIDDERLNELFQKQLPGLKKVHDFGRYTVNRKVFSRWVRKNWTKFLMTRQMLWEREGVFPEQLDDADIVIEEVGLPTDNETRLYLAEKLTA